MTEHMSRLRVHSQLHVYHVYTFTLTLTCASLFMHVRVCVCGSVFVRDIVFCSCSTVLSKNTV